MVKIWRFLFWLFFALVTGVIVTSPLWYTYLCQLKGC